MKNDVTSKAKTKLVKTNSFNISLSFIISQLLFVLFTIKLCINPTRYFQSFSFNTVDSKSQNFCLCEFKVNSDKAMVHRAVLLSSFVDTEA